MPTKGRPGQLGDLLRCPLAEIGRRVQPGADGGAADGEIAQPAERLLDALDVAIDKRDVAGEFLTECDRRGVLQMGTPDFDDVIELTPLRFELLTEIPRRRE